MMHFEQAEVALAILRSAHCPQWAYNRTHMILRAVAWQEVKEAKHAAADDSLSSESAPAAATLPSPSWAAMIAEVQAELARLEQRQKAADQIIDQNLARAEQRIALLDGYRKGYHDGHCKGFRLGVDAERGAMSARSLKRAQGAGRRA